MEEKQIVTSKDVGQLSASDVALADSKKAKERAHEEYLAESRVRHAGGIVEKLQSGWLVLGARAVDPKNKEDGVAIAIGVEESPEITQAFVKMLKARK